VDLLGRRTFVILEAGAELGSRDQGQNSQDTTRYYFGAEYRWTF
jgi:hypothetical protein